ncbi:MAG: HIRAN domain-containing protein [Gallionella sp.]|nr:HIRAN domain-containing protein [Gallionella sp.]
MARRSIAMKLFLGVVKAIGQANTTSPKNKSSSARKSQGNTKECPRCHYYFKSAACPYCAEKLPTIKVSEGTKTYKAQGAAKATDFLPPIPQGYQIYKRMLNVAGIWFYKHDASLFIRDKCQTLELEREPDNPKDKNAIRVIGITPTSRYFIGYVPKEISEVLVKLDLLNKVEPRLDRTYHGGEDYVDIRFQIIGLKENKKQFDAFSKNKPADIRQKAFLKFFNLPIPRGLTTGQAKQTITKYVEQLEAQDPLKLKEYEVYKTILGDFDNIDYREVNEIKKPSKATLNEALDQLRQEGHSYSQLLQYDYLIVDRLIKINPSLKRITE